MTSYSFLSYVRYNTKTSKKSAKTKKTGLLVKGILFVVVLVVVGLFWNNNVNRAIPPEVRQNSSDWPSANQNYSNTRAAVASTIDSSTISNLGIAWSYPIPGVSEWGAATTNPLILGNIVYFQDLKSNVYAVDFATGKEIWKKEYNLDIAGPAGVAVGYNKIFAVKGHFSVVALDLQGNELWSANVSKNTNIGVDIQPIVYDNTVYISTVPGVSNENFYKGGSIGVLYGLDATTGAIKWSFDTVDSANIWGNPSINSGGGAWYPPAIDPATNTVYWGIGNPAPWPGTPEFPNGSSRPGPNLFTGSMVALNQSSGKLLWYKQVVPHDLFDYDMQISPILGNITVNGQSKDVVFGAGKMGKVYAFDRKTGQVLWETPVGDHLNDTLTSLPPGVTKVAPSPLGGIETVMAYADGILYVPVVNMTVSYTPSQFIATSFNLGAGKGQLVALNAATGQILWSNNLDSINVGAATVVNDLVFTATYDGKIYAFNTKSGAKVWEYQAPGGINGWPAVKGDTIIFPVGLGKTPVLLAFKVGGVLPNKVNTTLPAAGAGKQFKQ